MIENVYMLLKISLFIMYYCEIGSALQTKYFRKMCAAKVYIEYLQNLQPHQLFIKESPLFF